MLYGKAVSLGEIKDEGTKNVLLIQLRALADIKE